MDGYAFWFTNAPTFMRLMNHSLRKFLGKFVVAYFDDILLYSKNFKDNCEHLRVVLEVLRQKKLFANFKKYIFCMDHVIFQGFVMSSK